MYNYFKYRIINDDSRVYPKSTVWRRLPAMQTTRGTLCSSLIRLYVSGTLGGFRLTVPKSNAYTSPGLLRIETSVCNTHFNLLGTCIQFQERIEHLQLTIFKSTSTTRIMLLSEPPHTKRLVCGTNFPQQSLDMQLSGTIVFINLQDPQSHICIESFSCQEHVSICKHHSI